MHTSHKSAVLFQIKACAWGKSISHGFKDNTVFGSEIMWG